MEQEQIQKNKSGATTMVSNTKSQGTQMFIAILACIALPLIIYINSLNAPLVYDSIKKIVENPDIKSLHGIANRLVYAYKDRVRTFSSNDPSRPVVYLTFALNYYWGRLNPFGYHLVNIVFHIFNTILVFFLTRKIYFYTFRVIQEPKNQRTDKPTIQITQSSSYPIILFSLVVALFFSAHPVHTHVVTYIFSRSDVLSTFFYLMSLLLFTRAVETNKIFCGASLFCFALSLFSKQSAITFPMVLLIFDYVFLSNYEWKRILEKRYYHLPYWILIVGYVSFRYFYLGGIGDIESEHLIDRHTYFITQPYVILRYLQMLLIPVGLCLDHFVSLSSSIFELRSSIPLLIILGLTAFMLVYAYRRRVGLSKILLFSLLWFLIILSPTSSIFPTTRLLVENRMYLSGIGFHLAITSLYFSIFQLGGNEITLKRRRSYMLVLVSVHIVALSILTWKRNQLYQEPILLWQEVVSRYPNDYKGYTELGVCYYEVKRYDKALGSYQRAIELNPGYDKAYLNLGIVYYKLKEYKKAIGMYKKAFELDPAVAETHNNIGILYYSQKEYGNAIQSYKRAIELNPGYDKAYLNLGIVYYKLKEYKKAIEMYKKAIELDPAVAKTYNGLGLVYYQTAEYGNALQSYQKAIELNPQDSESHDNLGVLYYEQKEYKKALQEFETALKFMPSDFTIQQKVLLARKLANK